MENLPTDYFTTIAAYTPNVHRDQYPAIDPTSPSLSLTGKTVIITGASAGIGAQGLAPAFAKAGAKVIVLIARNQAKLDAVTNGLRAQYPKVEFLALSAAVDSESAVKGVFDTISSKYGHADVLINNAGVWVSGGAPIATADPSDWWKDFEVNTKGLFLMSQGFLKLLGSKKHGTMVNMSSGVAALVGPGMSSYSVSKNATLRLMEYVAVEHPNVTAVSMQPGIVMTDMITPTFKRFAHDTPEVVGGCAVWLCSEKARFLSGRFVSANWDVEELVGREEEITAGNDLKVVYQGRFGLDQFEDGSGK